MSFTTIPTPTGAVSSLLDGPADADAVVLLGHGAGAGMRSDFMETVAVGLGERGLRTARFNFPYVEAGRKAPDRAPVLEATFAAAAAHIAEAHPRARLFFGGKSLGGRIASQVVASGAASCDGLVFLGYPLHPPGRPDRLRTEHLADIKVPMLFVEGTRDPFCPLDRLEEVRAGLGAETEVAVIDDGDHSFKVRRASGRDTAEAWAEVVDVVAAWVAAHA